MSSWNFAEVWREIAKVQPDAPAIQQGSREISWGEFVSNSERLAQWLLDEGLRPGSKVALYLYNSPEYLIGFAAALFAGCVPVNVNYRYGADELAYLFDNSDAGALIFHSAFSELVDQVRTRVASLGALVEVVQGTSPSAPYATEFVGAVTEPRNLPAPSPDDLIFLYTGGTTGMPKGVMWRNDDLFARLNSGSFRRFDENATAQEIAAIVTSEGPGYATLPACPLMHGTGMFTAISTLSTGGRVVLLEGHHYDPVELASVIDDRLVNVTVIVGDPFARPLLRALEAEPDRFSLSSLFAIVSSGAMWSEEIKKGLLDHHSGMLLVDAFSSSEALGMGSSVSRADAAERTARFTLGEDVRVVDDDGNDVVPGSDVVGRLMLGGRIPLGYYKDEAKTLATFQLHQSKRYSVPGDMAKVNADGTIQLLGRGSQCINTAGEKVFPEEVEETLKTHPLVADACVVGVPDEEYGQRVVAAVELQPGASASEGDLIAHVREHLAHYKAPRAIRLVDSIGRAVNGKMDYARHQREAVEWLAAGK